MAALVQAGVGALSDEDEKEGKMNMGGRIGMLCSVVGIASLLGGPVGGEARRIGGEEREGFVWMMVVTGGIMVVGCVVLGMARGVRTGWKLGARI